VALRDIGGPHLEMLVAFVSIQRSLSIGCPHRSIGKRLESSKTQCNCLPDIAAVRSSLRRYGRTKKQLLGCQRRGLTTLNLGSADQPATDTYQPLIPAKLNVNLIENREIGKDLCVVRWARNSSDNGVVCSG
jgi:hypothetical protein